MKLVQETCMSDTRFYCRASYLHRIQCSCILC